MSETYEKHPEQQGHTPTPWAVDNATDFLIYREGTDPYEYILSTDPTEFSASCMPGEEQDANAAFIVEAVNNHARLLAENAALRERVDTLTKAGKSALKTLKEMNKEFKGWGGDGDLPEFIALRDALAGGKS